MAYQNYLKKFWDQYQTEIPAVSHIYNLLIEHGEALDFLSHDHLALRTFNDPRVNIDSMMEHFLELGYTPSMTYDFPTKKLFARHYEPPRPNAPKVFISELLIEKFSPELQKIINGVIDAIPQTILNNKEQLPLSKVNWFDLDYSVYKKLLAESEYAAWLYAYGFRANHFAIRVNNLTKFSSCYEVNTFLRQHNFRINEENGEVKGSRAELLEQSSIMAENCGVKFSDGIHTIPACYYEFTHRFPDINNVIYPGFIAASADKLFESTDQK